MSEFLQNLFAHPRDYLAVGKWVNNFITYLLDHNSNAFDAIGKTIDQFAEAVELGLQALPSWLLIGIFVGVSFWRLRWKFAAFAAASFVFIAAIGFWHQTVVTLALTFSATVISLIVGVPLGIWSARNNRINTLIRPVLDFMQTMPAFVYLIPAAMLFGLGRVPGILATVIFAMPPAVRLTNLGHSSSQQGTGRSRKCIWRECVPAVIQGAIADCVAGHHDRRQPDHHDGACRW